MEVNATSVIIKCS